MVLLQVRCEVYHGWSEVMWCGRLNVWLCGIDCLVLVWGSSREFLRGHSGCSGMTWPGWHRWTEWCHEPSWDPLQCCCCHIQGYARCLAVKHALRLSVFISPYLALSRRVRVKDKSLAVCAV